MNIPAIRTALDAVLIPTTIRTLGSEKAVSLLEERSDGLHIGLKFAFPVAHIAADIANAVQEAVISHTGDTHIHLSIDTEIGTHKVQPGVATIKGVKTSSPLHRAKAASANQRPLPTLPPQWPEWARASAYSMPTCTVQASPPCSAYKTANPINKTKNSFPLKPKAAFK